MKTDNELIAEFMGVQEKQSSFESYMKEVPYWFTENNLYRTYARTVPGSSFSDFIQNSKYHESWDWLMPVVEKIESISYIGIDAIYMQIKSKTCQIWTYFDVKEFLRLTGDDKNDDNKFKVSYSADTKIKAVYGAVVEFIKWYNSQPNNLLPDGTETTPD